MKEVSGYVFMVEPISNKKIGILYGCGKDNFPEQFEENLSIYKSESETKKNLDKFLEYRTDFKNKGQYKINLKYAESIREFKEFENESNLVVMMILNENDPSLYRKRNLIGPIFEGLTDMPTIPGCSLRLNGHRTFQKDSEITAYRKAMKCHQEQSRQGDMKCTIGQLKIKKY